MLDPVTTRLIFDPANDRLSHMERARQIELLTEAGWQISLDDDDRSIQVATAPHDFASWEIAAAFARGLGISGSVSLDWQPENAWDEDPVSWQVGDPSQDEMEARLDESLARMRCEA